MHYLISIIFLLSYTSIYAASSKNELPLGAVKITKMNNPNCVEYFDYKGEKYCNLMMVSSKPIDPSLLTYEKQKIQFDNRSWKAVWADHNDAITTIEYVPAGQNINHWSELVTSQFIPGLPDVSAKEFANRFLSNLKKTKIKYTSTIIDKQRQSILIEFQVKQPKNLQQDELQKIVKTDEGIYVLHYAIKKSDMGEQKRQTWIKHLQASTLKK